MGVCSPNGHSRIGHSVLMWTRIKTRVMNALGFLTTEQIAPPPAKITINTHLTEEQLNAAVQRAMASKRTRLDLRNNLITTGEGFYDYDYMETAFPRKKK